MTRSQVRVLAVAHETSEGTFVRAPSDVLHDRQDSKGGSPRAKARVRAEPRPKALSRIEPARRKLYLVTGGRMSWQSHQNFFLSFYTQNEYTAAS